MPQRSADLGSGGYVCVPYSLHCCDYTTVRVNLLRARLCSVAPGRGNTGPCVLDNEIMRCYCYFYWKWLPTFSGRIELQFLMILHFRMDSLKSAFSININNWMFNFLSIFIDNSFDIGNFYFYVYCWHNRVKNWVNVLIIIS